MMYSNKKSLDDILKNKTTKNVLIIIFTCFVFSLLVLVLFRFNVTRIAKLDINDYKQTNLSNYTYSIEKVVIEDDSITIEGYIYKNNEDIKIIATHLVLKDENNNYYRIPTYVKYLEELVDDNNYGWSGFVSILNTKKINVDGNYKVYMLSSINEEEFLIDLNLSLKEMINNA